MAKITIKDGIISSSANYGLYHGTSKIANVEAGGFRVEGDIIAENLVVSSSVTHLTQSFSSGSTVFGDTFDDVHSFTGSIHQTGSSKNTFTNEVEINSLNGLDVNAGAATILVSHTNGTYAQYSGYGLAVGTANTTISNFNKINFTTPSTVRMMISSSGYVGIANSNPGKHLHIGDGTGIPNLKLSGTNTGTNPAATGHGASNIILHNASATDGNFSFIDSNNSNDAVDSRIVFIHGSHSSRHGEIGFLVHNGSALTERVRLDKDGNVGIGTDNPSNLLHLHGGSMYIQTGQVITWNNGDGQIGMISGYHFRIQTYTGSSLTEKMRVTSAGNVGIGTTTPMANSDGIAGLEIGGAATPGLTIKSTSSSQIYSLWADASGNFNIQDNTNNVTLFKLDANSRFSLSNNDTGTSNTIFGKTAGDSDGAGDFNVFLGELAGGTGTQTDDADGNVGVGYRALTDVTSGNQNVALGKDAATNLTSGDSNIAIGSDAIGVATTAEDIIAIGRNAAYAVNNDGADGTVAIGRNALTSLTSAGTVLGIGYQALTALTTGASNHAIGYQSQAANVDGVANVSFGRGTLGTNVSGNHNTAIGHQALETFNSNVDAYNTAVGMNSLQAITTGIYNTGVGALVLDANAGGESYNVAIGFAAMTSVDEGTAGGDADHNVAIGYNALEGGDFAANDRQLQGNIAIGSLALDGTGANAHTGTIAIGYQALTSLTSGQGNIAIGYESQLYQTDGEKNTTLGYKAFRTADNGESLNTVIGYEAGLHQNHASSDGNVIIGAQACLGGTGNRDYNIAIGYRAWGNAGSANNIGGSENIFIGAYSGNGTWATAASDQNTAVGYNTMAGAMNGAAYNSAFGFESLNDLTTGDYNTAIGYKSADALTTGGSNVALGAFALSTSTLADQVVAIGYAASNAALLANGNGSVAIGYAALNNHQQNINTAIGASSGRTLSTGGGNTGVGYLTLGGNNSNALTGDNNTTIGHQAGRQMEGAAAGNVLVGRNAGLNITTAANNTIIGTSAGDALVDETHNVAIGTDALGGSSEVDQTVVVGSQAGLGAMTAAADGTVIMGYSAGASLTSGDGNTLIGYLAGTDLTTGGANTIIGYQAMTNAQTNVGNTTAIGYKAGQKLGDNGLSDHSEHNIIIGSSTMAGGHDTLANNTANLNIAIGNNALGGTTGTTTSLTGTSNVVIGHDAMKVASSGYDNVIVGKDAGDSVTTGYYNTLIGKGADTSAAGGENQIVIGRAATGVGNNTVTLGASSITDVYMAEDSSATMHATGLKIQDGGNVSTPTFTSGFGGAGFRIDQGITTTGKTTMEADNLFVRGRMTIYELMINQVRATNGSLWISSTGTVSQSVDNGDGTHVLNFDKDGSGVGHGFIVNDLIRAQRWDPSSQTLLLSNLRVDSVASTASVGVTLQEGDAPQSGLEYVRIGNTESTSSRQGSIYLTADDSNAPFIDVIDGVSAHNQTTGSSYVKTRLGKLSGITSPKFGTLTDRYGLYASGSAFLEGTINASSGEIAGWLIGTGSLTKDDLSLDATNTKFIAGNGGLDTGTSNIRAVFGKFDGTNYGMRVWKGSDATTYVKLSSDGTNVIANWNLATGSLYNTGSSGGLIMDAGGKKYVVTTGSAYDSDIVTMGDITDSGKFGIKGKDTEGNLMFKLGMDGNVIAGWEISSSRIVDATKKVQIDAGNSRFLIQDASGNQRVRMGLLNGSQYGISGSDASGNLVFKLGEAGNVIAGWEISQSRIVDSTKKVQIDAGNSRFLIQDSSGSQRVRMGLLNGSQYGISGSDSSGNLVFKLGEAGNEIAGWTIATGKISSGTDIELDATNKRLAINDNQMAFGFDAGGSGLHGLHIDATNHIYSSGEFIFGTTGSNGQFISASNGKIEISSSTFNLKSDGSLVAAAGNFTVATNGDLTTKGQISASSGDIGGVSIESTSIVAAGGVFSVNKAGALVASSATITGQISASSGDIGGVSIGASSIEAAGGVFSVNKSGAVTATNISLSGSVSATTGDVGGWKISSGNLGSTSGGMFLYGSGSLRIGSVTNPKVTATTNQGFYADDNGNVLIKGDDNDTNYLKFAADAGDSALEIKTTNFSVLGGNVAVTGDITANTITANTAGNIAGLAVTSNKLEATGSTAGEGILIESSTTKKITIGDFDGDRFELDGNNNRAVFSIANEERIRLGRSIGFNSDRDGLQIKNGQLYLDDQVKNATSDVNAAQIRANMSFQGDNSGANLNINAERLLGTGGGTDSDTAVLQSALFSVRNASQGPVTSRPFVVVQAALNEDRDNQGIDVGGFSSPYWIGFYNTMGTGEGGGTLDAPLWGAHVANSIKIEGIQQSGSENRAGPHNARLYLASTEVELRDSQEIGSIHFVAHDPADGSGTLAVSPAAVYDDDYTYGRIVVEAEAGGSPGVFGSHMRFVVQDGGTEREMISIDGENQRVGINASSPSYTLDVAGDIRVTDDLFVDDFARIDALRVGTTATDPGDGNLYVESAATVGTDLAVGNKIHHLDDDDTYIQFDLLDQMVFYAGNVAMLKLNEDAADAIVFNEDGNDVNWRVESTGLTNAIKVDGGSDFIGIGTGTQDADSLPRLTVEQTTGNYVLCLRNTYTTDDSADGLMINYSVTADLDPNAHFIQVRDGNNDIQYEVRGNNAGGFTEGSSFTAGHDTACEDYNDMLPGMILESTGEMWYKPIEKTSETALPFTKLSNTNGSPTVFGVVGGTLVKYDATGSITNVPVEEQRYIKNGWCLKPAFPRYARNAPTGSGNIHLNTMSIGEGVVWITNINGEVTNGDFIESSVIKGYGRKQDDDILRSKTVAKCTETIDWSQVSSSIEHSGSAYKKYLAACTYHCG